MCGFFVEYMISKSAMGYLVRTKPEVKKLAIPSPPS